MTETTAKKGMVRYKIGYTKSEFDFDYLQSINYDDKRTLKVVVETLFRENANLKKEMAELDKENKDSMTKLKNEVVIKLEKFDKVFEKNIKEWLTKWKTS